MLEDFCYTCFGYTLQFFKIFPISSFVILAIGSITKSKYNKKSWSITKKKGGITKKNPLASASVQWFHSKFRRFIVVTQDYLRSLGEVLNLSTKNGVTKKHLKKYICVTFWVGKKSSPTRIRLTLGVGGRGRVVVALLASDGWWGQHQ